MDTVMQSALRSRAGADATTAGMFSVSSLGALAVIRGSMIEGANTPLRWVDREGRATSAEPASGAPRGGRVWMRMSPDRTRSVVVVQTAVRRETWMLDWTRDVWTPCRGCLEEFGRVVWSPDGRRLVSNKKGALVVHTLDESTPDEELFRDEGRIALPAQWLADGRLLFLSTSDLARFEVKVLDRQSREAHVVATGADPADAEVSPDGRWLAYSARQNGQRVVMVQAFPGPGSRVQISAGLGFNLAWSGDGRTIYYLGRTDDTPVASIIFAVDIHTSSTLEVGKPRELFRYPTPQACTSWRCYDLWPDGSRFLFKDRPLAARDSVSRMDLVLNWLGTLPSNR